MKQILIRLFNHEILTREEACRLLQDITRGRYNDTQIAALLTVFQMRGVKVDELIGFRDALLSTRIPIDLSAYQPSTSWGREVTERIRSTSLRVPASSWRVRVTAWRNTAITGLPR